jgi:hypothetical protein
MLDYEAGDVIVYGAFGGVVRVVLVDEHTDDVKNGRPGFGGVVLDGPEKGAGVWGYDDQITQIRRA